MLPHTRARSYTTASAWYRGLRTFSCIMKLCQVWIIDRGKWICESAVMSPLKEITTIPKTRRRWNIYTWGEVLPGWRREAETTSFTLNEINIPAPCCPSCPHSPLHIFLFIQMYLILPLKKQICRTTSCQSAPEHFAEECKQVELEQQREVLPGKVVLLNVVKQTNTWVLGIHKVFRKASIVGLFTQRFLFHNVRQNFRRREAAEFFSRVKYLSLSWSAWIKNDLTELWKHHYSVKKTGWKTATVVLLKSILFILNFTQDNSNI